MRTLHEAAAKALAVLDSFALHLPEILSGPDYEIATELRFALKHTARSVAVPMTQEEIYNIWIEFDQDVPYGTFEDIIWIVETHYGIKGEQE